jgi:hypothetical protein
MARTRLAIATKPRRTSGLYKVGIILLELQCIKGPSSYGFGSMIQTALTNTIVGVLGETEAGTHEEHLCVMMALTAHCIHLEAASQVVRSHTMPHSRSQANLHAPWPR